MVNPRDVAGTKEGEGEGLSMRRTAVLVYLITPPSDLKRTRSVTREAVSRTFLGLAMKTAVRLTVLPAVSSLLL